MLPAQARLRSADDFRVTVREGVRAGRRTVVVHAHRDPMFAHAADESQPGSPRVGFVVSKAVGNAVTRNRVKRQLRHLSRVELAATPAAATIVVRALPAAVGAAELGDDLHGAWRSALRKLERSCAG